MAIGFTNIWLPHSLYQKLYPGTLLKRLIFTSIKHIYYMQRRITGTVNIRFVNRIKQDIPQVCRF
jgi:hypothetical protein